ncbi:hypothetical protein D3C78_1807190 [compost metagenome]
MGGQDPAARFGRIQFAAKARGKGLQVDRQVPGGMPRGADLDLLGERDGHVRAPAAAVQAGR